ncbi:MAG: O-antigen polymerase [Candidatus Pelagibacter sp. TMED273]|nr:MAG: O-antigen polymerase [Candidatus Pelagibacter sp. TMED273]
MNNLKYQNTVLINLIISSIIPFLILGPFLPDLIVSVSSLFFLCYSLKNNNFYYFKIVPFIIFLLFCIIITLLSLESKDISLSIKSSLFYFRIGVFSCFIWYLIDKDKNILNYFYYALVLCFSVLVVDGYFQYFTGVNISGFKIYSIRVSSFFGDELIMGSYLSRLFPLLFALFLVKQKKKYETYFIGLLFILIDVLIFMSGERTAFFFLNLSTIFIVILIKEYQKFRLVTFIIAMICIFVLSLNSSKLSERMFENPAKNMGLIKNSSDKDKGFIKKSNELIIFTPEHDSLIRTAYNMFKDQPILGHGPKMFRKLCKDKKYAVGKVPCSTHPHNFYIQLLAETGIIGFLFLFSILGYVLYSALRQFKSIIFKQKRPLTDYQVCLLAGILITSWPFSPNGNFFNNWIMIVYSLPIGFYFQSIYSKKKNNIFKKVVL